ncbi:hypothetical protein [Nonomuraea insulae]|uniref:Acetyltransferase (GNAT) family protein n=1 Tax=Nonomuraea insulae TaxID=1616787 RepID=A0ABW1CBF9_9ACTN
MPFDIRPALAQDSAAIEAVWIATWRVAYRGLMPDAYLAGCSRPSSRPAWDAR